MNPDLNPYEPVCESKGDERRGGQPDTPPRGWPFWIAVAAWYFPLAICGIVFIASMANPESLGFWAVVRNGPLISILPDPSLILFVLPVLLEFVAAPIFVAAYRLRSYRFAYFLVAIAIIWGTWGLFLFLDSIHIS